MYEAFYGLSGKPFQLNPDPSFFFGSKGHKRALAYLEYGLHLNEGFIVITGEVGAGKTTLVRNLLDTLDQSKVVAAQLVSTHLDAEDMLRMICAAFGIPAKSKEKADLLLALEMFLVSLTAAGKRALLIVDEAQNLTPRAVEELRMLSNFQLGQHALLQSFLVGQPELRETMQSPSMQQLRQRVIASYHLGPLDADETVGYIEHRLTRVGWKGNPRFDDGAHRAIYTQTGGIPRRINTFCDRLLLSCFLSGKSAISQADVADVVAELKAETSTGTLEPAAPAVAPAHGVGTVIALPKLGEVDVTRIDEGFAARARALAQGFEPARLEERIVRLESTMNRMLALLQELTDRPRGGMSEKGSRK